MGFDTKKFSPTRLGPRVLLFLLVVSVVVAWILSNIYGMTATLLTGEIIRTYPMPRYGYQFNPQLSPEFESATYGMGFASVYFSSRHFFEGVNIYDKKYEITGRYSGFPPMTLFLYNSIFVPLPYTEAVVLHMSIQLLLLFLTIFWISRHYGVLYTLPHQLLAVSGVIFLTPVGLSWFERGNFDIYIAVSLAWLIFGIYESKVYAIVIGAFFANLKWTSMPFALEVFGIYLLCSMDKKKVYLAGIFIGITSLALISFPNHLGSFFQTMVSGQTTGIGGIALVRVFPRWAVNLLPVFIIGAYAYLFRSMKQTEEVFKETFLLYIIGAAIIDVTLPAISWEYRSVYLVGLVTQIFVWYTTTTRGRKFRYGVSAVYGLLAILVFILPSQYDVRNPEEVKTVITFYILSYSVLSSLGLIWLVHPPKGRR